MGKLPLLIFAVTLLLAKTIVLGQNGNLLNHQQVIELTLVNNKNIKISEQQLEIAKSEIQISKAPFNTQILGSAFYNNTVVAESYALGGGNVANINSTNQSEIIEYALSLDKTTKLGTRIQPGISLTDFGKDTLYNFLEPQGGKDLFTSNASAFLKVEQPLFRGAGTKYNLYEYNKAKNQYKITQLEYFDMVTLALYNSMQAYLEAVYYTKYVKILEETLERYNNLYVQLNEMVNADAIPAAELTYLNAVIAIQKKDIKQAQIQQLSSKEKLGIAMGYGYTELKKLPQLPTEFISDVLNLNFTEEYALQCFNYAQANKHNLLALSNKQEINNLLLLKHKNLKKPELNLKVEIGYNGIFEASGAERFYQPFFNNIPGANYRVGISYAITPKNSLQKGEMVKALASIEQLNLQKQQATEDLNTQIQSIYSQIVSYDEMLISSNKAVEFINQTLNNELVKLKLGTSTVLNLVQLQVDYNDLLLDHYYTKYNFNQALIDFRYLTGTFIKVDDNNQIDIDYNSLFSLPILTN